MLQEDEGRKLSKPVMLRKLSRVLDAIPDKESSEFQKIRALTSKIRFKKYVLTKEDMQYVNAVFLQFKKG